MVKELHEVSPHVASSEVKAPGILLSELMPGLTDKRALNLAALPVYISRSKKQDGTTVDTMRIPKLFNKTDLCELLYSLSGSQFSTGMIGKQWRQFVEENLRDSHREWNPGVAAFVREAESLIDTVESGDNIDLVVRRIWGRQRVRDLLRSTAFAKQLRAGQNEETGYMAEFSGDIAEIMRARDDVWNFQFARRKPNKNRFSDDRLLNRFVQLGEKKREEVLEEYFFSYNPGQEERLMNTVFGMSPLRFEGNSIGYYRRELWGIPMTMERQESSWEGTYGHEKREFTAEQNDYGLRIHPQKGFTLLMPEIHVEQKTSGERRFLFDAQHIAEKDMWVWKSQENGFLDIAYSLGQESMSTVLGALVVRYLELQSITKTRKHRRTQAQKESEIEAYEVPIKELSSERIATIPASYPLRRMREYMNQF